jgi:hypothetical protein
VSVQDIQFQQGETEQSRTLKLRRLVEEIERLSRGTRSGSSTTTLPQSGASVVLTSVSTTFPNGKLLQVGSGMQLDITVGLASINLVNIPLSKFAPIPQGYLLGRYDPGTGSVQLVRIGDGLMLVGGDLRSTGNGYPKHLGYARI